MLPQSNRLKHWREFQVVYRQGIRRSGSYLTLRGWQYSREKRGGEPPKGSEREDIQPSISPLSLVAGITCAINTDPITAGVSPTRIGISISQKVSKKAVIRNRIKRQIRAALRQLLPRINGGWHLVVVVRPTAVECDYAQFLQELEQLLVEAEILNGH